MNRAEQRQIMRDDVKRRNAREAAEIAELMGMIPQPEVRIAPGTMLVHADAKAIGAVTAITHRASHNQPRLRAVGVATGTELTSDGTPTVLVTHADGSTEIRTVSSYHKGSKSRGPRTTTAAQRTPETANSEKYGTHILTGE